jgi:hypothetical protein
MLTKLKDMASTAALEKAVASFEPVVREHLARAQTLGAGVLRDDASYAANVVRPAYLAVVAAASGATRLIPQFEDRFGRVMLALRDELVLIEDNSVRLVEDFHTRLPTVLVNSLKH